MMGNRTYGKPLIMVLPDTQFLGKPQFKATDNILTVLKAMCFNFCIIYFLSVCFSFKIYVHFFESHSFYLISKFYILGLIFLDDFVLYDFCFSYSVTFDQLIYRLFAVFLQYFRVTSFFLYLFNLNIILNFFLFK